MGILESITTPRDLRGLSDDELDALAAEIRDFLVQTCSRTGGHLGPNLGVVELTLAIHRAFDSPRDRVVFDTGHQAYVHKLLTGRTAGFAKLRQEGGVSGYPSQAESDHDIVENSHASTALQLRRRPGQGLRHPRRGPPRRRRHRRRRPDRRHGLGGAEQHRDRQDAAGWSSSSTTTAAPTRRRSAAWPPRSPRCAPTRATSSVLDLVKKRLNAVPGVGPAAYDALHAMKKGLKDALAPQGLFEDLGLKYVGPVDGHDRAAMEQALAQAKRFGGPVIVHAITRKGFGYDAAERARGRPVPRPRARSTSRPARRTPRAGSGPTSSPTRSSHIGERRQRRRRDHRRDDAPGRAAPLPGRASPSAPSTSASPSSTPPPRPPASRSAACTRSSRSTPRSSTGPSTRC